MQTRFSARLRSLRLEAGLSQSELSKLIGISKSSVNMYERGEREPGFETLEAIADYFNVDMDFLLGKSDVRNMYQLLKQMDRTFTVSDSDPQIEAIMSNAKMLNAQGLAKLEEYSEDLVSNPKYKKGTCTTVDFGSRKYTAAARSGDRVETAQVSQEEEEAALPPDYTGDI